MTFSPELADIRFGCGLSPVLAPTASRQVMLDGLAGPDEMAARFPVVPFSDTRARLRERARIAKLQRAAKDDAARAVELDSRVRALRRQAAGDRVRSFGRTMLRWAWTGAGFRERLAFFWADHFTTVSRSPITTAAVSSYVDEAIRPRMAGSFADLLIAAVTHPVMLHFLDQNSSIGPGSRAGARSGGRRGLNENLAREVMELHTLGVDGPYTQADVRQLAELFTGLTFDRSGRFMFRPQLAEPGAETVLGRSYGGDPATLEPVLEALRDLAVHPATARHVAGKLAVHFVRDAPDPALIEHVEARFRDTGGDLAAVYEALLEHPAAWDEAPGNVKPPADFVGSAFRALAVSQEQVAELGAKRLAGRVLRPLALMGQRWQRPGGPNGWPEEDGAWITPQGLAARLRWSMAVPRLLGRGLPDPRRFVAQALADRAGAETRFAAAAAETRAEAIGLVLASPDFQRR